MFAGILVSFAAPTSATAQAGSALTKVWDDGTRDVNSPFYNEFKDLSVSVSQTKNLTNQGILVDWEGMSASVPGEFSRNYVQMMQCWGDASGPTPEQCQWGTPASATENLMGSFAANRDLMRGEDPKQLYNTSFLIPPPVNQPFLKSYRVPFTPVTGTKTFNYFQYFAVESSNELSAAPTGVNGEGQAVFETQTAFEAPHLGCGADAGTGPRKCWLVIVPRGEVRADGTTIAFDERIGGSPLSASYWENRIQVPLEFANLTVSCALGNAERRVVGSEMIAAAITSWQPALCKDSATFGYSQIGDGEARRQIVGSTFGSSGLAFVSDPLDEELTGKSKLVYAPIANSAVVIGFNIEKNFKSSSPLYAQNGTLVTDLKLNARLVAKLLTQSYRADVPGGNVKPHVKDNPRSLIADPEFLALNPDFADWQRGAEPGGLLTALGASDAASMVWKWIQADPKASAFLKGTPDEWGMVLNSYYSSLDLANDTEIESFPKADLSTYRPNLLTPEPGFSTLDMRPYAIDMLDAALASRRGDSRSKTVWDLAKAPPAFTSAGAQATGQRFMISITDLPAARRYGLGVASLVNADGVAIAPTENAVSAGLNSMPTDQFSGAKFNDGKSLSSSSYPWTTLTYAVVNTCTQTEKALGDYADLLTYASSAGQVPGETQGQLPIGYFPLPSALIGKAEAAASLITSKQAKAGCPVDKPVEPVTPTPEPTDPAPVDPVDPPVDPPTEPTAPIRADSFKTWAESPEASRNFVLGSIFLALPVFLTGRALTFIARKRKLNGKTN
jgi:hypothetical protein